MPKYCRDAHRQAAHRARRQADEVAASADFAHLIHALIPQMSPPKIDFASVMPSVNLAGLMPEFDVSELVSPIGAVPTIDLSRLLAQFDTEPFRDQVARFDISTVLPSAELADLLENLDVATRFPKIDLAELIPNLGLGNVVDSEAFAALAEQIEALDWNESIRQDEALRQALAAVQDSERDSDDTSGLAEALAAAALAQMLAITSLDDCLNELVIDIFKTQWVIYLMAWQLQQSPQGALALSALSHIAGRRSTTQRGRLAESEPSTPRDLGAVVLRHRSRIVEIAADRKAFNVRLFGSVARGDANAGSDIDLLVDLDPEVGLVGLAGLERELTELLGCAVDVVPAANLKPGLLASVEAEAIAL